MSLQDIGEFDLFRLSAGTIIVALFAILFGLTGAYAARRFLEPRQLPEIPPRPPQPAAVPLASADLIPGKPITLGDIMLVRMSAKQIKERGLPPDYMTSTQQIIGRTLRVPTKKGEPFMTANLYPEGMVPNIADRLKPGYRAVTIPIRQGVGSVAHFALAGTHVDVLFRLFADTRKASEHPETTYNLINDAEVLAMGDNSLPGGRNNGFLGNVTLAVTPDQANRLKVVEGRGDFSIVVRNPGDDAPADGNQGLTLEQVLALRKPPVEPVAPPPFKTEIYRGRGLQVNQFSGRDFVAEEQVIPPGAGGGVQPPGAGQASPNRNEASPDFNQLK